MNTGPAIRRWLPAALWQAAILYFGVRPISVPTGISHEDKMAHAIAFGILAWLVARALASPQRQRSWRTCLAAMLAATASGAGLELLQKQLPHRSCEFADGLADALGAVGAILCIGIVRRWRDRRQQLSRKT